MASAELLVTGPKKITTGITGYTLTHPDDSSITLQVEDYATVLSPNTVSVNWLGTQDYRQIIGIINRVWSKQPASSLYLCTAGQQTEWIAYKIEPPIDPDELLQNHPKGFKWMRVESPQEDMPDFFAPLIGGSMGIIQHKPLRWNNFIQLYESTAVNLIDQEAIRRALTKIGIDIS